NAIELVMAPVGGGNIPPTADAQSITMFPGVSTNITLTGSDFEESPLIYSVETLPAHGTLTGATNVWTYTPANGYQGTDSFTFTVNDGQDDSSPATVSILVTNEVPSVTALDLETAPNTPLEITLNGIDPDNGPSNLTYIVSDTFTPAGGSVAGASNSWLYVPPTDYQGEDSFSYAAFDGIATSDWATVTITVTNYAPVASAQSVGMLPDTNLVITLTGSDADNGPESLTYEVVDLPTNGVLNTDSLPQVTYTPNAGYEGMDTFTFKVNDGLLDSEPAAVLIKIKTPTYLAAYDFSGVHSGTSDVTVVDAHVVASGFRGGAGIGFDSNTGVMEVIGDTTGLDAEGLPLGSIGQLGAFRENQTTAGSVGSYANAVAGDRYLTFTVTPENGYALNLSSLSFKAGLVNATRSPEFFALNTSVDGFATSNVVVQGTISSVVSVGEYESFTISLADSKYQNLTEETEFRLYIWGATAQSSSSATSYDKVALSGTANFLGGPAITATVSGGSLVLSWEGTDTYDVLTNANLALPVWGVAQSNVSSPVTNAIGSEPQLFYMLSK
ncbi:Ig-like domain-containing protein, partial [Pontiella sp.]|uniref:Ig-like domain-containing protein n=1 Tax=Pontiella sp. TaxID=2837462 RepID=UPI0035677C47